MCASLTRLAIMLYNDKQRKQAEEVVHRMVKRAVEMGGTVTGEHGVGLVKRDYLNHELGETTVDAMRKVASLVMPVSTITNESPLAEASFRSLVPTKLRQSCKSGKAKSRRDRTMVEATS
jgi:hypothetical protein